MRQKKTLTLEDKVKEITNGKALERLFVIDNLTKQNFNKLLTIFSLSDNLHNLNILKAIITHQHFDDNTLIKITNIKMFSYLEAVYLFKLSRPIAERNCNQIYDRCWIRHQDAISGWNILKNNQQWHGFGSTRGIITKPIINPTSNRFYDENEPITDKDEFIKVVKKKCYRQIDYKTQNQLLDCLDEIIDHLTKDAMIGLTSSDNIVRGLTKQILQQEIDKGR